MKIIYKKGDVLNCTEPWIVHGCNAQCVMGSGVALAIRKKWPSAYATYIAMKEAKGMKLGAVSFAEQDYGPVVFNAITQEFYGRDGRKYVSYSAIREAMQAMDWYADTVFSVEEGCSIAMPMIGAGLGGGDWETISAIIEEESKHFQPIVYTL